MQILDGLFLAPHRAEPFAALQRYARGATLATACTGALVLAAAGLLDGEDVTTHWAYCDAMAKRYPRVRMHPNRALVISGREQRLIMAGGGTAWHDLALFLIARFVSTQEAAFARCASRSIWAAGGRRPAPPTARAGTPRSTSRTAGRRAPLARIESATSAAPSSNGSAMSRE
jgi:transcriptional regulator GlxA family with amidase domain